MASTTDNKTVEEEYYIKKYFKENYALELFLKAGGLFAVRESEINSKCNGSVIFKSGKRLLGKGFYDYKNSLDEECLLFIDKTLERSKRKKTLIAKLFIVVVMCACVAITIIRPIMKYLLGEHRLGTPDDVPMWTPFNKGAWYVSLIVFLAEDLIAYITPGIVFGSTLFIVFSCEDIGSQFVILGHTLMNVVRRAASLNMPRDETIKYCFSHSIRRHQIILESIKSVEMVLNIQTYAIFGLLSGSTIMMCMSGFMFFSERVTFPTKLAFCMFLVSELAMIFIVIWCGELIQQTRSAIFEMVYFSEWPGNMKSMKNYIVIIQLRSMEPIVISFGGLIVASYETFNNICTSAFSYFNILLAVG